jgi:hypothetical protein
METISFHGQSVVIDAENGGIVSAVLDANGVDLMAVGNHPNADLRAQGDLGATGFRGWIDCFPTINGESDRNNGRPALNLTAHGELWNRRWRIVSKSRTEVTMRCDLPELGVTYSRTVRLARGSVISISKIENLGSDALQYVWASHPLLAADSSTWVELEANQCTSWPPSPQGTEQLNDLWPGLGARRAWSSLPFGFARKLFLPWPEGGVRFASYGRERRIDFAVVGDSGQARAHLGLWLNREGFPVDSPLNHFAIEPTIGDSDSLDASARRDTAGELEPKSSVEFIVQLDI